MRRIIPSGFRFGLFVLGMLVIDTAGLLFKFYSLGLGYVEIIVTVGAVIFFSSIIL